MTLSGVVSLGPRKRYEALRHAERERQSDRLSLADVEHAPLTGEMIRVVPPKTPEVPVASLGVHSGRQARARVGGVPSGRAGQGYNGVGPKS